METTRFLVTLTRAQDSHCRVTRTVRRSDQNRVVFYASNWLLQTQRLEHYFGVTYNVYEIYEQNPDGEWVLVETESVANAEARRTVTRPETAKSQTASVDQKSRSRQGNKIGRKQQPGDDQLIVTDKLPRTSQQFRDRKTVSPFQQRVRAELELARLRVEQQRGKGES